MALASCQSSREVHADGDGPLSPSRGGGSFLLAEPPGYKSGSWVGTFAGGLLCAHEPGVRIELQRVGWRARNTTVEPLAVDPVLRHVDEAGEQRTTPIEMILGTPQKPGLGEKPFPGRYRDVIRGVVIDQPCSEVHGGHEKGFTELLFVVKVGKQGFDVPKAWIDYLADGDEYRLELQWDMLGCGDVIAERGAGGPVGPPALRRCYS